MLNRYFVVSGGLHIVLAGILMFVLSPDIQKPTATYSIDFLGQSFQAPTTSGEAAAAPAPEVPAPKAQESKEAPAPAPAPAADKKAYAAKSEITTKPKPKKKEKIVLGTPSILAGDEDKKPAQSSSGTDKTAAGGTANDSIGSIETDLPNFPYPWYITQIKNSLWNEWEKRKPKRAVLQALISFTIQQNGSIKDIKVTKSSSNAAYDYAAKSSVESAAPFAPLPKDLGKDYLTVTVEFKDVGN